MRWDIEIDKHKNITIEHPEDGILAIARTSDLQADLKMARKIRDTLNHTQPDYRTDIYCVVCRRNYDGDVNNLIGYYPREGVAIVFDGSTLVHYCKNGVPQ